MTDSDSLERGIRVRREVLGDAYVEVATASADDLTRPFQELRTRDAWGEVWSRDVLDRSSRSMITLALLRRLRHPEQAGLCIVHRAALR